MVCEFRCDGEDLFAIFLEAEFAEAFDGEEFLFGVRDVGGDGGQGGKLHDHVGRDIVLLETLGAPFHKAFTEFFIYSTLNSRQFRLT